MRCPCFRHRPGESACSTSDVTIEPVLNLMKVTLRAAGSSASFLANRFGLVPKLESAFAPAFTIASSVAPSVRTYVGAAFGNREQQHALRGLRQVEHAVLTAR